MNILELIEQQYRPGYLGARELPVTGPVQEDVEIIRAYLCDDPDKPFFGDIIAVIEAHGRYFQLVFHVWREHQTPSEANRLSEIQELVIKTTCGIEYLDKAETGFGTRAFWWYTPDKGLDEDSLALRAVAKRLKAYSVRNGLCKQFRKLSAPNKKGD